MKSMKMILVMLLALLGMQSVWAFCAGTAYFMAPSDWTQAVFSGQYNMNKPLVVKTRNADGYFVADLADIGLESFADKFSIGNKEGYQNIVITDTTWAVYNGFDANYLQNYASLPCPGVGNQVYIMQNPLDETKTYIGSEPSNAKYFYFLVPQDEAWQSDNVIIRINGTKDTAMVPAPDMCGWFYMVFDGNNVPTDIVLYRKNDPTDQLGLNGVAETGVATPIALSSFYSVFNSNSLYFVPDDADWITDELVMNSGWSTYDPGVPEAGDLERCTYKLAALIYDTDQTLNPAFTSDPDKLGYGACVGVHKGIVNVELGPDKKPVFSGNANATKCFSAENFSWLFNYTPGKNEVKCYDMPFRHYGKDTRWGFDSDSMVYGKYVGGFYPVEDIVETPVVEVNGVTWGPTPAARTPRKAEAPVPVADTVKNFDHYCNTPGWSGGVDCEGKFKDGNTPAVWNWGVRQDWTGVERNQQFCFESHAKFTYYEDQEFTFRGDDDIWVFINNKLAVDIGGAHLATPGHVVLKNLNTTYGEGFLVPGNQYDLDIFFCDRRTTMSNVMIKTNMYIHQKSDITLVRDKSVTGSKSYNVCYTSSGDGSCAGLIAGNSGSVTRCGSDIVSMGVNVSYWLVKGRRLVDSADVKSVKITDPGVYNCVIDVTNMLKPNIGNQESICGLSTGRYTLFMGIDGKYAQVATFRPQGDVDVVYREAVAKDTSASGTVLGKFSPKTAAMAGEWVPVYISNVHEWGGATDPLEMLPQDAVGVQYTLNAPGLKVCLAFAEDGSCARLMNENSSTRTIGPSGVDTVYVTADAKDLTASTDFKVNVVGKATSLTITFFLPTIMFIEAIPEEGKLPVQKTGEVPNADGSYEEFWVGSTYDFYLGIFKPDGFGGQVLCPECELTIHRGDGTSKQVMFEESTFKNGYATISVISTKEYRSSLNKPAVIEVSNEQGYAKAQYTPVFFKEAPVSTPRLADVFDVRGANPSEEFNIPAPYFSMNQEYLDGIADSVVIYYHHSFRKDSLPTRICIAWDSSLVNVDSLWHNPYKEGFSTVKKDTSIFCNVLLSKASKYINCSSATDSKPYCSNKVKIGGLKLSANVKTGGSGKVISYAKFVEEDASGKKKEVKQGFSTNLIDRVAPVPLSAELFTYKSENVESLVVTMSEPVKLNFESMSVLDFYLNSAADLKTESSRYASKINGGSVVKATSVTTVIDTANQILVSYNRSSLYPDVGDYVRLTGNLKNVYWSDRANINVLGSDSLRDASADEKYHWNSPTAYDETKRLASPWVAITGGACRDCNEDDIVYGKPSFRVKMVGPFKFAIVLDGLVAPMTKTYAVMDMQGRILHQGKITSTETVLPVLSSGSYIVKVGLGTRRVNIH